MNLLVIVFFLKISISLIAVVVPFLCLPQEKIEAITNSTSPNAIIFRLYGVSILALLIGYSLGLKNALAGVFPNDIVIMGIVSNAGGSLILLKTGAWKTKKLLFYFFTSIAILLSICFMFPTYSLLAFY